MKYGPATFMWNVFNSEQYFFRNSDIYVVFVSTGTIGYLIMFVSKLNRQQNQKVSEITRNIFVKRCTAFKCPSSFAFSFFLFFFLFLTATKLVS
jgi:hypothetical protein